MTRFHVFKNGKVAPSKQASMDYGFLTITKTKKNATANVQANRRI